MYVFYPKLITVSRPIHIKSWLLYNEYIIELLWIFFGVPVLVVANTGTFFLRGQVNNLMISQVDVVFQELVLGMCGCGDSDGTVLWSFMLSSVLTVTSPKTTKTKALLLVGYDCRKYMFVDKAQMEKVKPNKLSDLEKINNELRNYFP